VPLEQRGKRKNVEKMEHERKGMSMVLRAKAEYMKA
jgi:hypothetical protein